MTSPAGSFSYTLGAAGAASPLVKKLLLPNTSYITDTYDGNARLLGTWLKNSGNTTLDAATYGYNAGNQRTNATGTNVLYTYDKIGQLKVADSSVNAEDRGYTYDAAEKGQVRVSTQLWRCDRDWSYHGHCGEERGCPQPQRL